MIYDTKENYSLYEIITGMVGRITPVGETYEDAQRANNLEVYCDIVYLLLQDIIDIAPMRYSSYHSVKEIGKEAYNGLLGIKGKIDRALEDGE